MLEGPRTAIEEYVHTAVFYFTPEKIVQAAVKTVQSYQRAHQDLAQVIPFPIDRVRSTE